MSSELSILALYGLVVIVTILIQVLAAAGQVGLVPLAGNREGMDQLPGMAGRLDRAQHNSVIALALFAPAVLILQAKGGFSASTLLAAQVFLLARIAYVVVYAAGVPWVRTLVWVVAFLATLYLYIAAM
ncbi:MAPEG family protein [Seohaeicola zhoushanensis]|uniref:MAPEG family protein n=1 Tax=Seohaeicola zhoushanensis TaxID=1569283 RepID=A0A8J3M4B2_9RHOB|nr:MAPEG family protein [Seohaeicola zhoushanensis]GHF38089.1 hypothetical protein GCM10017056_07550 [Seohaeicola zhoushanensis]